MTPFFRAVLCEQYTMTTSVDMKRQGNWRRLLDNPIVEWSMFACGIVLMGIAPILGPIPGPGGIPIFVAGLVLVLKSSLWAKRHYVRFKRWQPKAGRWMDWALRRQGVKRKEVVRGAASPARRN